MIDVLLMILWQLQQPLLSTRILESLIQHISTEMYAVFLVLLSFAVSYVLIPKLISVANYKSLMVNPNSRSSHTNLTPTLGGIAFYISVIFSLFFLQDYDDSNICFNIMLALTILFITGIKDDLVGVAPKMKIAAQFMAITFLLLNPELFIEGWNGFLGITSIPDWVSIMFSYFGILTIINAYNMIDGIDGLAALLGIVIFSIFALVFYSVGLHFYALLALSCIGFIIAFLRFNLSKMSKIFMGDTGSMIVGFLIGVFTLRFLALRPEQLSLIHIKPDNLFLLIIAILFIPLLDVLRVVVIRLLHKKGPFTADQNHMHHIFIKLGWSHIKTSVFLTVYGCVVAVFFYVLNIFLSAHGMLISMIVTGIMTLLLLFQWNPAHSALKQKRQLRDIFLQYLPIKRVNTQKLAQRIFRIFF